MESLLLPVFEDNYDFEFFDIVSGLNTTFIEINNERKKRVLPYSNHNKKNENELNEYIEWFNIIVKDNKDNDINSKKIKIKDNKYIKSWGKCFIYDEEDLLNDLEKCQTLEGICKKCQKDENEIIKNLNNLYLFLKKKNRIGCLENYSIIPNQNKILKSLRDKNNKNLILLYSDSKNPIPKTVRKIYDQIVNDDNKLGNILINENLNLEKIGVEIPEKNFLQISKYFNDYLTEEDKTNSKYEQKFKLVYNLISIEPKYNYNDNNIDIIKKMYKFSSEIKIFNSFDLPEKMEEESKIDSKINLWNKAINFWLEEHPKQLIQYNNLKNIQPKFKEKKTIIQIIHWLNDYFGFLKLYTNNFELLKIFPGQDENFHFLKDLYFDSGFPEEFKDILNNYFKYNLKEKLLPKEIVLYKNYNILPECDVTSKIVDNFEKMKDESIKKEATFKIISLKPKNDEKYAKYCEKISYFGKVLFNFNFEIKQIETKELKYIVIFNYAFNIISDFISSYKNYDNIKAQVLDKSDIKTEDNFCDFLSQIIISIWDGPKNGIPLNNILNDFDKKKIFLLQNNNFSSINEVKLKLNYDIFKNNKEIEDNILYVVSKNKYIDIDYKNILLNKKMNENLINYSSNFGNNILKLEKIFSNIDEPIIKKGSNLNFAYNDDDDFINLIQTLKDYLKKINGIGSYLPFFNKNQHILYFRCLKFSEFDDLFEIHSNYKKYKNGINDILELMKKNNLKDFKALYEFYLSFLNHGPCQININGNFKFFIDNKQLDCNNLTIKENFTNPLIKSTNNHNENFDIEFEITPKYLNKNENKNIELGISIKQNK